MLFPGGEGQRHDKCRVLLYEVEAADSVYE